MRPYIVRHRLRALLTGFCFTMGAAPMIRAQQVATPARTITFDSAITIALRQNASLRQSENAAALSATVVSTKKNALLPNLSFSTSTAENVGRNFSQTDGAIVNQATQSLNAGISSSVVLFDGMRNLNELRQAQSSATASVADASRAKQTAVFTVSSDFLTLVTSQAQLQVQQQNYTTQEAQESQLEKLVAAGARPVSELYQQQATTAAAKSGVLTTEHQVELANIALIQTLQLDPRGTYDFVAPRAADVSTTATSFQLDSLLDKAFASRSDLDADAARVDAAVRATKVAQATRMPTVSVSAGYNTAYSSSGATTLADQLNQRRGGAVSVGVSIPIFDRGAAGVAEQQAKIQEDNARLALANQRQTVALEVRRAYLDYESTRQQLAAAQAQQKSADLAVSTTQQRYQLGSSTLLELTQARAGQVQAATAVANAKNALSFQRALMSYYTGDLDAERLSLE